MQKNLIRWGECWAFINEGNIVAFCSGYINNLTSKKAFLQLLLVSEKWQKKGLGESLIKEFCNYVENLGFLTVQLTVVKRNERALNLYNKIGFVNSKCDNHLI